MWIFFRYIWNWYVAMPFLFIQISTHDSTWEYIFMGNWSNKSQNISHTITCDVPSEKPDNKICIFLFLLYIVCILSWHILHQILDKHVPKSYASYTRKKLNGSLDFFKEPKFGQTWPQSKMPQKSSSYTR